MLVLGAEIFSWKLHSCGRQSSYSPRHRWKGTEACACFLLSSCYMNLFEGCISFAWTAAYYGYGNGPTTSGRTCEGRNILNISGLLIHTQVAAGSLKDWTRLLSQKTIFCFIHNRCLSVTITCALWWNTAGRDEHGGGITGAEKWDFTRFHFFLFFNSATWDSQWGASWGLTWTCDCNCLLMSFRCKLSEDHVVCYDQWSAPDQHQQSANITFD